jgi:hypothetical protein
MQLSLTTTLPRHPRAAVLRPLVPLSREAAMSQLDQIAAASSQRVTRQDGLGGVSAVLALFGGLVLVGAAAMWRSPAEAVPVAEPATPVAAVVQVVKAPQAAAVLPPPAATIAPEVLAAAAVVMVEAPPPAAEPSPDEVALKTRARQLAEARRKAAALAQERIAAEEAQRLQAAVQRREGELQAQAEEQRAQRAAADAAARQAQATLVAMNTRRSVRETCNGRGLFAEGACHMRECTRSEHQADPVCVRQRETDEAQRRASIER